MSFLCEKDCKYNVGSRCKYFDFGSEGVRTDVRKASCDEPYVEMLNNTKGDDS